MHVCPQVRDSVSKQKFVNNLLQTNPIVLSGSGDAIGSKHYCHDGVYLLDLSRMWRPRYSTNNEKIQSLAKNITE